jgi:hypothetical protein
VDLAVEVGPDSEQMSKRFTACGTRCEIRTLLTHGASGVAIGADPERILALHLEEVGDFLEDRRDLYVADGRPGKGAVRDAS